MKQKETKITKKKREYRNSTTDFTDYTDLRKKIEKRKGSEEEIILTTENKEKRE